MIVKNIFAVNPGAIKYIHSSEFTEKLMKHAIELVV